MYPLEILLVLALAVQLTSQNLRRVDRRIALASCAIALAALALSALFGQARWQMTPVYLLTAVLSLLLLIRKSFSHVVIRCVGVGAGLLLLTIGVLLSMALPIVTLPAPQGPHVVGFRTGYQNP